MEKLLIDMMMESEYVVPLFEACAELYYNEDFKEIRKKIFTLERG